MKTIISFKVILEDNNEPSVSMSIWEFEYLDVEDESIRLIITL
jgi:hypothetical protein